MSKSKERILRRNASAEVEVESAWEEETRTLKQTIRIYFPPVGCKYSTRRGRPGKVHVYSDEEIQEYMRRRGGEI
jgi:hypothetical protein